MSDFTKGLPACLQVLRAIKILLIVLAFLAIAYDVSLSFSHPDMTRTRLLTSFWKEYLLSLIFIIPGYYVLNSDI